VFGVVGGALDEEDGAPVPVAVGDGVPDPEGDALPVGELSFVATDALNLLTIHSVASSV